MDDEKVTVQTIEGPLTYTFEAEGQPVVPKSKSPPPPKPKKKKKKKKKKRHAQRVLRNVTLFATLAVTCLVCAGIFSRYNREYVVPTTPQFNYSVYKSKRVNTTSIPWSHSVHNDGVLGILEGILRHTNHHVVCMHHIQDMPNPYRACVIHNRKADQMYAVLNPHIIGEGDGTQQYREESIACNGPIIKNRFNSIMLKWERLQGTMYALFEGPEAVAIQLSLDEFVGNHHCGNDTEHNKTNKHTGTAMG